MDDLGVAHLWTSPFIYLSVYQCIHMTTCTEVWVHIYIRCISFFLELDGFTVLDETHGLSIANFPSAMSFFYLMPQICNPFSKWFRTYNTNAYSI